MRSTEENKKLYSDLKARVKAGSSVKDAATALGVTPMFWYSYRSKLKGKQAKAPKVTVHQVARASVKPLKRVQVAPLAKETVVVMVVPLSTLGSVVRGLT